MRRPLLRSPGLSSETDTVAGDSGYPGVPRSRLNALRLAACTCWSAALLHCDSPPPVQPANAPPDHDRESWNTVIDMRGRTFRATLSAPHLLDYEDERETRADSGAEIVLLDSTGRAMTLLAAERMLLQRRQDRLALAGDVVVEGGDSLVARSDSLVWNREDGSMLIPGIVQVALPSATMTARKLTTTARFDGWAAEDVRLQWRAGDTADRDGYDFELTSATDDSRRQQGALLSRYERVTARVEGNRIRSDRAVFDDAAGVISFDGRVEFDDGRRALRAAEVRYDLRDKRSVALGDVELVELPDLQLWAAEIGESDGGERWRANGLPVRLTLSEGRGLQARRVTYERADDRFDAAGSTVFSDGERRLEADSLHLQRSRDLLGAIGAVVIRASGEFDGVATGNQAMFDLSAERITLNGSPLLRRARATGDSLSVLAGELSFHLAERQIFGSGGFTVATAELTLKGGQGRFDSEAQEVHLARQVEFTQRTSTGRSSRIVSDSMTVVLADGHLESVEIPTGLEGAIALSGPGSSWIVAARGSVLLSGERLKEVILDGDADVTHRNIATASVSRFQSRSMSLNFDEGGQLVRVTAEGGAEVVSRLPEDGSGQEAEPGGRDGVLADPPDESPEVSINTVRGEKLEILLREGEVQEVRVIESIEGRYTPAPGEEGKEH